MGSRLSLPEHETPSEVGQGLADWVVRRGSDRILDPAMGSGALLRTVLSRYESMGIRRGQSRIYGIEIDPRRVRVAAKALGGLTKSGPHLFVGDFLLDGFAIDGSKAFDGIICNPPFLRWQEIPSAYRESLNENVGRPITGIGTHGLAGLHVFFVRKGFEYAKPGGRLAFILPSTTFAASYATPMKRFLKEHATIMALLAFDSKLEIFPGVLTNVSLLLFEKRRPPKSHRLLIATLADVPSPEAFRKVLRGYAIDGVTSAFRPLQTRLAPSANWANLVTTHSLRRSAPTRLGSMADVHRGIATGCNAFFTLSRNAVKELRLPRDSLRRFVPELRLMGYEVSAADIERAESAARKTFLFYLRSERETNPAVKSYLDFGAATGVSEGYLTSHRDRWYRLERRTSAPILFTYMTRTRPRFLHNTSGALYLSNLIGIYPKEKMSQQRLRALLAILNSDQVLIRLGRLGRRYAGGLLKVEPGDLSRLYIPDIGHLSKKNERKLAESFRQLTLLARIGRAAEGLSNLNKAVMSRGALPQRRRG